MTDATLWDTHSLLSSSHNTASSTSSPPPPRNALIILNSPLPPQPLFRRLWDAASLRFCADGGANRLFDRFVRGKDRAEDGWDDELDGDERKWLPDLVLGDLDSLREDARRYYEGKGVRVEQDPDEYSTDLGKTVARLSSLESSSPSQAPYQLIIVGGLSGRLDQTVHTLHALTLLAEKEGRERVWTVGRESAAVVLKKGKHHLKLDLSLFGRTCGILPLGTSSAYVTTTGLEWNLGPNDHMYPTSLSTAVSTSNHLVKEDVTVETDVAVIWTMEVRGGAE
ncbi:putative KEX1 protein [Rhodotorula toruloides ATCC 204091]|uniref:Thiamine pyrophosphokinase n=1 Tax=Rhodotorula toruloides TaxID=5286 RepID=A0A0K3CGY7_RHOTO|nr:putative KEX1 protein [Rhodotorula toruloides ATCC 204091]KAK4332306.1 Thiamine pyrophosphokinase [Rhodotorula toruloides]PRQ72560.1 putative KEX1 protein [Rhodotorula toruloides]